MILGNTSGFENGGGVARFANQAGEAVQLQTRLIEAYVEVLQHRKGPVS